VEAQALEARKRERRAMTLRWTSPGCIRCSLFLMRNYLPYPGPAAGPTPGGILKRRLLDAAQTAHGELSENHRIMGPHPTDPDLMVTTPTCAVGFHVERGTGPARTLAPSPRASG
jgi:hypothetical protein